MSNTNYDDQRFREWYERQFKEAQPDPECMHIPHIPHMTEEEARQFVRDLYARKEEAEAPGIFGLMFFFVSIIATMVVMLSWDALLVTLFWEWFIAPVFNIRQVHFTEAIGIVFVFGWLQSTMSKNEGSEKHEKRSVSERWERFLRQVSDGIALRSFMLLFGFLLAWWLGRL